MDGALASKVPIRYSTDKEVTTVLLSSEQSEVLKFYRCHVCGRIVFSYYGNVRMALPGEPLKKMRPKLVECQSKIEEATERYTRNTTCKARYWVT